MPRASWDVCRPSFSPYLKINQTPIKQCDFFKKLTSQELGIQKLPIFFWSSTFLPYKMPSTINELRVEVTTNALGKMQYFALYDRIDMVLDQCHYYSKFIKGSFTTHSNIYRASFAFLFLFLNLKCHLKI